MKVKESKTISGLMKFLASFVTVAIFYVILGFLSVFLFWIFFFAPLLKLKFLSFYDREQHALHVHTVQAYLQ